MRTRFLHWSRHPLPLAFGVSALLAIALVLFLPTLSFPHATTPVTAYPEISELRSAHLDAQGYADYFRKLAERKGAVYAFGVLGAAPIPAGTDAHSLGHVIGDVLYKQKGIGGIEYCTQDFRNACSHSIVIGFLEEHGPAALLQVADACAKAPGGNAGFGLCFHGLGHGLLAYEDYDLKKAVALCMQMGTQAHAGQESRECVGGTIMEMIAGAHDPIAWQKQEKNYFKDSDPLYPCDADWLPDTVRGSCYVQLTPHLLAAAGGKMSDPSPTVFPKAFSFCAAIPKGQTDNRDRCYGGFGATFIPLGQDLRTLGTADATALTRVRQWCALAGDGAGERACDATALSTLFWGGEESADSSFTFCSLASGSLQDACYIELADQIRYYVGSNAKGAALCARLPAGYRPFCKAE